MKKMISVLMAMIIAVASLPALSIRSEASGGILDLDKMRAYADTYWKNYNPAYEKEDGSDCCNFASQILIAGGLDKNIIYTKYIPYLIDNLKSNAFYNKYGTRVEYYNNYTGTYPSDGDRDRDYFTIDDIEEGDFVTLTGNYGRSHIVYVLNVDRNAKKIYFAAHTRDAHGYYGKESDDTDGIYNFSIIKGVLKTSALLKTSSSGSAELDQTEESVVETAGFMYGDVNGDGKLSITDVVQVNLVLSGQKEMSAINAHAADVDLDNAITNDDLKYIGQMLSHLRGTVPVTNDYKCYYIYLSKSENYTDDSQKKVMDVEYGYTNDGTNVSAYHKHGADNQIFMIVPVYSVYTGSKKVYSRIIPLCDEGYTKCINVSGNNVQLDTFEGYNTDLWLFELAEVGTGKYYIKSALGGYLYAEDYTDKGNISIKNTLANKFDENMVWILEEVNVETPSNSTTIEEETTVVDTTTQKPQPVENLSFSENGVKQLCQYEGFHDTCYKDATQSSIGYGTKCTGSSQQPHASGSHSITKEEALAEMKKQVEQRYAPIVRKQTAGMEMTQYQFDALVSLCYNTGGGKSIISKSPLVKYLKGKLTEDEARTQYERYYIKSNGKVLQGLINRRKKEAELFFTETGSVSTTNGSSIENSNESDIQLLLNHSYNISINNKNNTKEVVKALQRLLNAYGNYGLDVDGIFGTKTRKAVRSFQGANGLTVDGIFGTKSKEAMKKWVESN